MYLLRKAQESVLKTSLAYISIMLFTVVLISSCGSSKAAIAITQSYGYKLKLVHMENKNSTYDNLAANYIESIKSSDQKKAEAFAKDTLISMTRTACIGRCPEYSFVVYNNGNSKYIGTENVQMIGIFQSKLNEVQVQNIKDAISKVELLKMYNKYPRGVKIVGDVQSTKLILSDGTLKFPTEINYGQPEELTNIQNLLDQIISELSWVQI